MDSQEIAIGILSLIAPGIVGWDKSERKRDGPPHQRIHGGSRCRVSRRSQKTVTSCSASTSLSRPLTSLRPSLPNWAAMKVLQPMSKRRLATAMRGPCFRVSPHSRFERSMLCVRDPKPFANDRHPLNESSAGHVRIAARRAEAGLAS
jgi:hypothetical protein